MGRDDFLEGSKMGGRVAQGPAWTADRGAKSTQGTGVPSDLTGANQRMFLCSGYAKVTSRLPLLPSKTGALHAISAMGCNGTQ